MHSQLKDPIQGEAEGHEITCEHSFGLVFKELKIKHWECSKCGYLKDLFGNPKEKANEARAS